jgi:hypothetical protein
MFIRRLSLTGVAALLISAIAVAADQPAGPAYQIVLRSRSAEVTPLKSKDAQTAGGAIRVEQPEPNTIVIAMTGGVIAGSQCKGSHASMQFDLEQDLEIIPTRSGLRPPRLGMVGQVTGTLQVSEKGNGSAEQSTATAVLVSGEHPILAINVRPSGVAGCGNMLSINNREGPVETAAATGCFQMKGTFHISAAQTKGICCNNFAVADFDPAPQFDSAWSDALKPFRAVLRKDFGFRVVLRVVEDAPEQAK